MDSWLPEVLKIGGPTVGALVALGLIGLRAMPHWKEVRLAEIGVRKEEASSIGKLSNVFSASMESTEELKIFLRASMRHGDVTERRLTTAESDVHQLREGLTEAINSIRDVRERLVTAEVGIQHLLQREGPKA